METTFKMTKFRKNDSGTVCVRVEVLPSGKRIVFGVAGTDLSVLQFGGEIDFDRQSDDLVGKCRDSQNDMAFEYVPNVGFDEVPANQQKWFSF